MFPCNELDLLLYCLWLWLTRADKEAFSALPPSPAPASSGSVSAHCSPGWGSLVKEYMESLPGSTVEVARDKMANGHCPTTPASTLRSGENKSTVPTMDNTDTGSQQGNSRKKLKWSKASLRNEGFPFAKWSDLKSSLTSSPNENKA